MADLVAEGSSIEGDAVNGSSRQPLASYGLVRVSAGRCYKFVARQDVRARVTAGGPPNIFFEGASNSPQDEIVSEQALILSRDDKPTNNVSKGSHTHQASHWRFTKRTGVQVSRSHQEIKNALAKRLAAQGGAL